MSNLHPLLQPWRATYDEPFGASRAAHLLNRAGFGGRPDEIEELMRLGPEQAVERLLDFPDTAAAEQDHDAPDLSASEAYPRTFAALEKLFAGKSEKASRPLRQKIIDANRQSVAELAHWWLDRMRVGRYPLQEKLALFWHGHFTTSAEIEWSAYLLWRQNELLRRMSAGDFRAFVHAVARDPAMLSYLDNSQNHKQQPNENFARELLELFTLGIGRYSESDVREAARAFTGWTHDGEKFVFDAEDHDTSEKTFLGESRNFDGDDIVERILHQPACARFIAGKLFRFFVGEVSDETIIESLAEAFREADFGLRPLLRTILTSRAFYKRASMGTQIKSPIQLVVGTARLLEVNLPRDTRLLQSLREMGQAPLFPPDVNGWPSGRNWITTNTLFQRHNIAGRLAGLPRRADPAADAVTAEQVVDLWSARLLHRPVQSGPKKILLDALRDDPHAEQNVRSMLQLLVSLPEYQLC